MNPSLPRLDNDLIEGSRIGRYLLVRDIDGLRHALATTAVVALSEEADGDVTLLLPGGRGLRVPASLPTVLHWLAGQG